MTSATHKAHLSWVRPPIEKSIGRAQVALDFYFEKMSVARKPPTGVQQSWIDNQEKDALQKLEVVINEIDLIHSAMVMVSSKGGSTLTSEMLVVCSSIQEGAYEPKDRDRALLSLMGGLVSLPNYINMVISGAPDAPSILAKPINEIREVRNVPLLVEESILPDLAFSFIDPPAKDLSVDPAHRERVFERVARPFQSAFGNWIGSQSKDSLREMKALLADLQEVTQSQEVGCYWWVAEVLVDLLIEGGLRHNNNTVTQLRTVSVAIQKASTAGEGAAAEALGKERFKSLLYVISMSKSQTEESESVLNRFNVSSSVDSESLKALQEKLDRSSEATTETVAVEVAGLLSQSMVSLGRAVSTNKEDVFKVQVGAFLSAIRDVANIFFMVNDEELAAVAKTAASRISGDAKHDDLTDDVLEALKSDMLYLDARLKNIAENEATRALGIDGVSHDVISGVVSESLKILVSVRRSIALHVDSGEARDDLREGLQELLGVASVTEFSGAVKIGAILKGVAHSLIGMLDGGTLTESDAYENAARALVATEIYLESVHSGFEPDPQILEQAIQSLALNSVTVGDVETHSRSDLVALFNDAAQGAVEDEDSLLVEMVELRSVLEAFALLPDFTDAALLESVYQAADRISISASINNVDGIARLGKSIAIFAKEVHAISRDEDFDLATATGLAKDSAALMMRCFDEYAARKHVAIFVTDVANALTSFIDASPIEAVEGDDVEPTELDTNEHAEPAEKSDDTDTPRIIEDAEVILASEVDSTEVEYPEGVDPYMIELYRAEYRANHDELMSFLASPNQVLNEHICRAVHTLRGCSGSAQCMPLNRVFAALENRFRELEANHIEITNDAAASLIELLTECMDFHLAFPWQTVANLEDAWIDMAKTICSETTADAEFVSVEDVAPEMPVEAPLATDIPSTSPEVTSPAVVDEEVAAEELTAGVEPITSHGAPCHEPDSSEPGTTEDHTSTCESPIELADTTATAAENPVAKEPEVLEPEYDQELASFYIEEADERLPQLQDNFQAWLVDLDNRELITTIKRQMHTLKGAAAMASLGAIQDVTHLMESLFESLSLNIVPADQSCIDLVAIVLQEIEGLSSAVRANLRLRRPEPLIRCLEAAVEKNVIDLSILDDACTEPAASSQDASHEVPAQAEDIATAPVATDSSTQAAGPKKTRRGGRGKGAAKRHAAQMASPQNGGSESADDSEASAVAETIKATSTIDSQVVLKPAVEPQRAATSETPELSNTVPKPASGTQAQASTPSSLEEAIALSRNKRHLPFDDGKEDVTRPVVSQAVREIMERTQSTNRHAYEAQRTVSTEKIKVDQRLLETAVVQSSELTASRHRQLSLQKEMTIGLKSIREKMEAHSLQQNQFIQMLRGYINQPGGISASHSSSDDMQLERFNDISSMAVQSAAYISQILQDLQFVMETGDVMQESFRNQGRLISSLQRDLIHSRLVPFNNLKPALNSTIENTSKLVKKKVRAEFVGGDTILDKKILDAIKDPLFHILRNAIDHGMEKEEDRIAAGKPAEGTIRVGVARRAKNMIVTISDDGRGIDPVAVRNKAISSGIIKETDELTDREIIRLITHNGFSTAQTIGHISGRGVGMDIVASAVESMGGMLQIESQVGKGTTFTLELPFSIGSNRAMICYSGGQWFAIPTFTMTHVASCQRSALDQQVADLGYAIYEHEGESYSVINLADLIAMPELKSNIDPSKSVTLLLCKHGSTRVAIEVEKVDSMPEIHIRELEGILRNVRGLIGETELSDGTAIFVLDVMELIRINMKQTGNVYAVRQNRVRTVKRETRPLAFVVDDATSYRRQLTQYFEARGFEVITARDGQDAVDMLPLEREPAIITVDVEMPRLDGFGLTKRLRAMPELDHIPIIMLTTRTGLEEQAKAAGVNVFQNKPCDYPALDKAVRQCRPDLLTNNEDAA